MGLSGLPAEMRRPPLAVRVFRLAGAFASVAFAAHSLGCVVRGTFSDGLALAGYGLLLPLLAFSAWVCRAEVKESLRAPRVRAGLLVLAQAGLGFLVLGALLYAFGYRFHTRFDCTAGRVYRLSEETLQTLAFLPRDETIEVYHLQGPEQDDPGVQVALRQARGRVNALLEEYQAQAGAAGARFAVSTVKLLEEPLLQEQLARRAGIRFTSQSEEALLLFRGTKARLITANEMLGPAPGQPGRQAFVGERVLSAALRALVDPRPKSVYFTTGHGEKGAAETGQFRQRLALQQAGTAEWETASGEAPADADSVIVCGPSTAFAPEEVRRLAAYLERGGRLLLLADPHLPAHPRLAREECGLAPLCAAYGLALRQDLVTLAFRAVAVGDPRPVVKLAGLCAPDTDNPILHALRQDGDAVAFGRPCAVQAPGKEGCRANVLLESQPYQMTQERTWADPVTLGRVRREAGDESLRGPVPLAACAERASTGTRLVVVAGSDAAEDGLFQGHAGNQLFLLAAVRWLCGEDERAAAIPPRDPEVRLAKLEERHGTILFSVLVVFLPMLLIFAGVLVWAARRQ